MIFISMFSCLFYFFIYLFVLSLVSLLLLLLFGEKMIFFKTTLISIHVIKGSGVLIPSPHDSRTLTLVCRLFYFFGFSMVFLSKLWWQQLQSLNKYLKKNNFLIAPLWSRLRQYDLKYFKNHIHHRYSLALE